jgi:hypothetical protein
MHHSSVYTLYIFIIIIIIIILVQQPPVGQSLHINEVSR